MAQFAIGDTVRMPGVPIDITVKGFGTCDEDGCGKPTVEFADPESGETDSLHADELVKA